MKVKDDLGDLGVDGRAILNGTLIVRHIVVLNLMNKSK
jgi:hypothetical protein